MKVRLAELGEGGIASSAPDLVMDNYLGEKGAAVLSGVLAEKEKELEGLEAEAVKLKAENEKLVKDLVAEGVEGTEKEVRAPAQRLREGGLAERARSSRKLPSFLLPYVTSLLRNS